MTEAEYIAELQNIAQGQPLEPGRTLSHATANGCVEKGWAKRNMDSQFVMTQDGWKVLYDLADERR